MSDTLTRSILTAPILGLLIGTPLLTAQQPPPPPAPEAVPAVGATAGVEELTRGPIHEAFGQPVVFDPQPGTIAPKDPPTPVEEVPPDQRPAGDNVAWIPGYWAWDDDQNQFVWVSGFWRDLPPGRVWVPGYWTRTDQGNQWVSGYWAPAGTGDTPADVEYLPEPPASLEAGPPGPAPSADQIWVPGTWVWQTNRYAWRPGFWSAGSPDWVWMPAHYQWSPLGYAYVPGYWDYPLWRRGLLFAPATFSATRPGLTYTPRLALNTGYLGYAMFARPRTGSYYFGDYYANNYLQNGYYPWFSFHNTRYGYDPLFAHTDWTYGRQNIDWESNLRQVYYTRRDQAAARPAPLYRDYVRGTVDRGDTALVRPLTELRTAKELPFKMEPVNAAQVKEAAQQARAVRDFGAQRARLEGERAKERGPDAGVAAPVKVRLPEAPRITGTTATRPASPKGWPEQPVHPQPDPTRKPEPRPPQPQPKVDIRPPQPLPKVESQPPPAPPKIEIRPPQPQPKVDTRPPQPLPKVEGQPLPAPPKIETRPPQPLPKVEGQPLPAPPKVETRPPQPLPKVEGQPPAAPPKIDTRPPQPQPRPPGTLPHPEEVLHPAFDRRAGQTPAPLRPATPSPVPPVRVTPPPAAHPVPPPITGMPHPAQVPVPKGKQ